MVSFLSQTLYASTLGRGGWMGLRASVNALEERNPFAPTRNHAMILWSSSLITLKQYWKFNGFQ